MAVPLLAAGPAQAAIAGANPITTQSRPDLQYAQVLSSNHDVQVCFDKQLATTSTIFQTASNNLGNFLWIAGYRSHNRLAPSAVNADQSNNKCLIASFPQSVTVSPNLNGVYNAGGNQNAIDTQQYTVLTIAQGAVTSTSTNGENLDDSATLVPYTPPGSSTRNGTHNGTTGLTTAPDLVGTSPGPTETISGFTALNSTNSVVFTFDQNVMNANAADFFLVNQQGELCRGSYVAGIVGNAVDVYFAQGTGTSSTAVGSGPGQTGCIGNGIPTGTAGSITGATPGNYVRDGVYQTGVSSAADPGSYNGLEGGPNASAVNQGATGLPDLKSASLVGNGNTVEYVFDKPINAITAADFEVILSPADNSANNGAIVYATNVTGGSVPNSIDATFSCNSGGSAGNCLPGAPSGGNTNNGTNLQNEDEYAVLAAVAGNAVGDVGANGHSDTNSEGDTNVPGSAPIGGNLGAFGNGYTTGADAYAVTINRTNGVVTVYLDQRVDDCIPSQIQLIQNDGTDLGSPQGGSGVTSPFQCGSTTGVIIPGYQGGSADYTYPSPGPESVNMQFLSAQTANAAGLQLKDSAFFTPLFDGNYTPTGCTQNNSTAYTCDDNASVAQVLAPVGSGAHLKAVKHTVKKAKKAKKAKHHSRKHTSKRH